MPAVGEAGGVVPAVYRTIRSPASPTGTTPMTDAAAPSSPRTAKSCSAPNGPELVVVNVEANAVVASPLNTRTPLTTTRYGVARRSCCAGVIVAVREPALYDTLPRTG